ncbi:MAG: sulfite exporter TauE/SafE family protein [Longimicrobiales bacterium]
MAPAIQAAFIAVGLLVGFVAGLIGIGGGVLMVPFLYFVYETSFGGATVGTGEVAAVAHATSLFVIVPTAIVGVHAYARAGLVAWRAAVPIGLFSLIGGVLGARLALMLPEEALKIAFGLFLIATAIQLVLQPERRSTRPLRIDLRLMAPVGVLVGIFSAILGVGGGLVAIPLLLYFVGLGVERVAATSLAIIVFAATAGTATYMLSGSGTAGLPAGSIGYVHTVAALPLMLGAVFTVRLGTCVNQRMGTRALQWVFAIVLFSLGARLVLQGVPGLV